jgi:Predicted signaling protein consisting of a modified GGDEF domain and a DHH domain
MNGNIKFAGHLRSYLRWPALLSIILLIMNVTVYFVNTKAGVIVTAFVVAYLTIVIFIYIYNRNIILNELISFATQYGQVQKSLMRDFILPYALLDDAGNIMWANDAFQEVTGKKSNYRKSITNIMPEIPIAQLPRVDEIVDVELKYDKRDYKVTITKVDINELLDATELIKAESRQTGLYSLCMFDETKINEYMRKNEDEKLVSGLLYLDNYEEATEMVEEVRRSLLAALVERKIKKYFDHIDGVVKRLERDKYFIVMRRESLERLKVDKFSLLEEIKSVNIGNDMAITMSMGVGLNADSFSGTSEYARNAMELALGRGGDQVVIKDRERMSYFGGKSQVMEKTTRVKARVKALALKEFISNNDNVVVMGHRITDIDSFGAAVGVYRAAKTLGKKAHIVINSQTSSIRPFMKEFMESKEYGADMFVNSETAKELTNNKTVLVVVDTSRPSYTECQDLLYMTKTIVILDHHRQGNEVIRNAVLSYIEPYASSACEMIAEILQYFAEGLVIRSVEADSIYAGIMIDTNNFMSKTGVRTFEAAAFLRRCGADVTRVRKMFREKAQDYKARGEAIRNAELFHESYAISACPSEGLESPTVVCAQAANELLNIEGVKASFVLTYYNNMVYISARAIDEVNVQIIMEKMDGGGHLSIAGTQLKDVTLNEAKDMLKQTLQEMIDGGDI